MHSTWVGQKPSWKRSPLTLPSLSRIGERNGNPLQGSCLENPRDGGAWWAAISGVAQSRTRLKRLSNSSSRAARTYTALGNRLLEGTNKTLCTPGPRRKEQWPHKRLTKNCLCVSKSLRWRHGLAVACRRVGRTEGPSACMGPFEGSCHYLHYLHHSLASGQITGREHSPTLQQKIGLKFTEHGPAHQNKTPFIPQSVSPIRKLP